MGENQINNNNNNTLAKTELHLFHNMLGCNDQPIAFQNFASFCNIDHTSNSDLNGLLSLLSKALNDNGRKTNKFEVQKPKASQAIQQGQVLILRFNSENEAYFDEKETISEDGVKRTEFVDYKTLSDEEKKNIKLVDVHGLLVGMHRDHDKKRSEKEQKIKIKENKEMERNLEDKQHEHKKELKQLKQEYNKKHKEHIDLHHKK